MAITDRVLSLLACACLCSCATPFAQDEGTYVYRDLVRGKRSMTVELSTRKMILWDVATDIAFCSADLEVACLKSALWTLAIPRSRPLPQSWTFEGQRFELTQARALRLLGREVSVFVVTTTKDQLRLTYYYSEKDGLIAVAFTGGQGQDASFILENSGGLALK